MKTYLFSAALLVSLPFLSGSISKEPDHALLPVPDAYLTKTTPALAFQTETQEYLLRLIYRSNLNPDINSPQAALALANDVVFRDVNVWTSLAGVVGQPQLTVVPGQEAQAQRLMDAIANRIPFTPRRTGNIRSIGVIARVSTFYRPLRRYGINVGRATLYSAYGITENRQIITAANGQPVWQSNFDALLILRRVFRIRVSGERIRKDDFKR